MILWFTILHEIFIFLLTAFRKNIKLDVTLKLRKNKKNFNFIKYLLVKIKFKKFQYFYSSIKLLQNIFEFSTYILKNVFKLKK